MINTIKAIAHKLGLMEAPPDKFQLVKLVDGWTAIVLGYTNYPQAAADAEWAEEHWGGCWRVRNTGGHLGTHPPLDRSLPQPKTFRELGTE